MALIGAVIITALCLSTFVLSFIKADWAQELLAATLILSVVIPCIIYGMFLIARLIRWKSDNDS